MMRKFSKVGNFMGSQKKSNGSIMITPRTTMRAFNPSKSPQPELPFSENLLSSKIQGRTFYNPKTPKISAKTQATAPDSTNLNML